MLCRSWSGGAGAEWQAELTQGPTWTGRGLRLTAAAVVRAARELHDELAEPIDAAISEAREKRAARVAELEAELGREKGADVRPIRERGSDPAAG